MPLAAPPSPPPVVAHGSAAELVRDFDRLTLEQKLDRVRELFPDPLERFYAELAVSRDHVRPLAYVNYLASDLASDE